MLLHICTMYYPLTWSFPLFNYLCCVYQGFSHFSEEWTEVGWTEITDTVLYGLIHSNICKLTFFTYIWSYNSHQCYPMNCKTYAKLDMFPHSLTDENTEFFTKLLNLGETNSHLFLVSMSNFSCTAFSIH